MISLQQDPPSVNAADSASPTAPSPRAPSILTSADDETLATLTPAQIRQILQECDEARQSLDHAHRKESIYRILIENLHMGIVLHAADSQIVFANEQAQRFLGMPVNQMLGKDARDPCWRFVRRDGSSLPLDEYPVMQVLGTGKPVQKLVVGIQKGEDQEVTWGLVNAVPEFDPSGALQHVVVTFIGIGDLVRTENALEQSEDRFRVLADDLPALICEFLPDSVLTYVNRAYADYFETTPEALIGQPFLNFIPETERQKAQDAYLGLTPEQPVLRNIHQVLLNGEIRWQEWRDRAIFNQAGQVLHYRSSGFDITEQKEIEAERARFTAQIQAQAQQIAQILDTVPEGVILLDGAGRVLLANPAGQRDLNFLAGIAVGQELTHLGQMSLISLLASVGRGGSWHEIRQAKRIFQAIARPISTGVEVEDPTASQWVLVINDVTHARDLQNQVEHQQRLVAVGQLAAGIAHDFNNILAVMSLHLSLLNHSPDLAAGDHGRLETVVEQVGLASQLIQQILDFSRRAVLERRTMELAQFLDGQVKLLSRTLPENIEISLVHLSGSYTVLADPTRMQQVIMNLVVNARDAMPKGGLLRLSLSRQSTPPRPELADGSWICLSVADNGTGIPLDLLPHIFEPFFTTKSRQRGSGLGLAQVHGIVKQHNGEIDVQSTPGQGSTFTIYLPEIRQAVEPAQAGEGGFQVGRGQTILVVEDNPVLLEVLAEIVQMLGYHVLEARHGAEALDLLQDQPHAIDLVLSDLIMPVMGGDDLLLAMRKQGMTVPMLILSGHPLEGELGQLKEKGLAGWLLKPVQVEDLSQLLAQTLD
jgi:PAS domain S-box-containing protein